MLLEGLLCIVGMITLPAKRSSIAQFDRGPAAWRITSSGLPSAIQGYLSSFHIISASSRQFLAPAIDLCAIYSNPYRRPVWSEMKEFLKLRLRISLVLHKGKSGQNVLAISSLILSHYGDESIHDFRARRGALSRTKDSDPSYARGSGCP